MALYDLGVTRPLTTIMRKKEVDALEGHRYVIAILGGLALIACAVGVVIGVVIMFHGIPAQCSPGSEVVTTCTRHPHAGEGAVIVLFSFVLAALVVISQIGVRLLLDARTRELGV
jgi:hypothetical protein